MGPLPPGHPRAPTLQDLCEPVFQRLCRLGRRHRAGVKLAASQVRADLTDQLVAARAPAKGNLLEQFELVEPAILLAIDRAVRTSGWPCAADWTRIPLPDDGVDRFAALLRDALADPTPQADERLAVLGACAAVAFASPGGVDPALLEQLRLRLAAESLLPLSKLPPPRRDELCSPSQRPLIAIVAFILAALGVWTAFATFAPPAPSYAEVAP